MAEGVNNHGYTIEEPPSVGIPVGNGNDAWPEHQESFQCNSESEVDSFTDSDTEGRVAVVIAGKKISIWTHHPTSYPLNILYYLWHKTIS